MSVESRVEWPLAFGEESQLVLNWSQKAGKRKSVTQVWRKRDTSKAETSSVEWHLITTTTSDSLDVAEAFHALAPAMEYLRQTDDEPDFLSWHAASGVLITRTRSFGALRGRLRAWDPSTTAEIWSSDYERAMTTFEFSDNGERWIGTVQTGVAESGEISNEFQRVWDAKTGDTVFEGNAEMAFRPGAAPSTRWFRRRFGESKITLDGVSPDGSITLSMVEDAWPRFLVLTPSTGTGVKLSHRSEVTAAAFSFDSRRLVTLTDPVAAEDAPSEAMLWEASTGKLIRALHHDAVVIDGVLHGDGKHLLTASADGTAASTVSRGRGGRFPRLQCSTWRRRSTFPPLLVPAASPWAPRNGPR